MIICLGGGDDDDDDDLIILPGIVIVSVGNDLGKSGGFSLIIIGGGVISLSSDVKRTI